MIIGHRTKSDRNRTIVYKVTIPDDPNGLDVYEMEKNEVERAIERYNRFNVRARAQIVVTKDW